MRYAVVNDNNDVVNVIEWDGQSRWMPKEGHRLIRSDICDRNDKFDPEDDCFTKADGKKHHKDKLRSDYKRGR